jgi:hypothetical protein
VVAIKLTCIFAVLATLPRISAVQPATQPVETPPDRVIHVQKGAPVRVLGFGADGKFLFCGMLNDINEGVAQVELASGKAIRRFQGMGGKLSVSAEGPARTLFNEVGIFQHDAVEIETWDVLAAKRIDAEAL